MCVYMHDATTKLTLSFVILHTYDRILHDALGLFNAALQSSRILSTKSARVVLVERRSALGIRTTL